MQTFYGKTLPMKISLIKNIILNNKILILLFVILISCDSMGDSSNDGSEGVVPDNPTVQPSPTDTPPTDPNPLLPPQDSPPVNPNPPLPQNPAPVNTNPPLIPTAAPPTNPSPTPNPTPTPQPTNAPPLDPNPNPTPDPPLDDFQSAVLSLVNAARSQARNCGSEFFPAAPPVNWDIRIEDAAFAHSHDMAQNENFSHTGTDGSNAGDRLLIQGYNWNAWGENILVGLDDARDAVDAWIGSPGHCSIIMSPLFEEVGAGVSQDLFRGNNASYWTLIFATES